MEQEQPLYDMAIEAGVAVYSPAADIAIIPFPNPGRIYVRIARAWFGVTGDPNDIDQRDLAAAIILGIIDLDPREMDWYTIDEPLECPLYYEALAIRSCGLDTEIPEMQSIEYLARHDDWAALEQATEAEGLEHRRVHWVHAGLALNARNN